MKDDAKPDWWEIPASIILGVLLLAIMFSMGGCGGQGVEVEPLCDELYEVTNTQTSEVTFELRCWGDRVEQLEGAIIEFRNASFTDKYVTKYDRDLRVSEAREKLFLVLDGGE